MIEVRIFRNKAGEWFYSLPDNPPVSVIPGVTEKSVTPWEDFTALCGRWVIVRSWETMGRPSIRLSRPAADTRPGLVAVVSDSGLVATTEHGQPTKYKVKRNPKHWPNANPLTDRALVLMCALYAHINNYRLVGIENLSQRDGNIIP